MRERSKNLVPQNEYLVVQDLWAVDKAIFKIMSFFLLSLFLSRFLKQSWSRWSYGVRLVHSKKFHVPFIPAMDITLLFVHLNHFIFEGGSGRLSSIHQELCGFLLSPIPGAPLVGRLFACQVHCIWNPVLVQSIEIARYTPLPWFPPSNKPRNIASFLFIAHNKYAAGMGSSLKLQ